MGKTSYIDARRWVTFFCLCRHFLRCVRAKPAFYFLTEIDGAIWLGLESYFKYIFFFHGSGIFIGFFFKGIKL